MIIKNLRLFLSAISLFSMTFVATSSINAAPVRFNQVTQVVNAKPGQATNGNYTNLLIANDPVNDPVNDPKNDPKKDGEKTDPKPPHQDRVITQTTYDIIKVSDCFPCRQPPTGNGISKYWALLGLAVIPFFFIDRDKDSPTPHTTMTPHETMTPHTTPTPPEPIPEPMTILLFGTGLAGIGMAARKRFGKREEDEEQDDEV